MRHRGTALVCGFWDEASGLGGLAWSLEGASGGLLAQEGDAKPTTLEIDETESGLRIRLDADGGGCEVDLAGPASEAALTSPDGEAPAGEPSAAIRTAAVRIEAGADGPALECFGHLTRWKTNPLASLASMRHLAIPASEGALLVVTGGGAAETAGHGEENVGAWLLGPEGEPSAFAEALLSTQYDDAGRQTRAGLELWPSDPDAPPSRAAGTALGALADGEGVSAALLRSSMEGTRGLGSYLIRRS